MGLGVRSSCLSQSDSIKSFHTYRVCAGSPRLFGTPPAESPFNIQIFGHHIKCNVSMVY